MSIHTQIDRAWTKSLRDHAVTPILNGNGKLVRPINERTLILLDTLWKRPGLPPVDLGKMIVEGRKVVFWSDPHFGHDLMVAKRGAELKISNADAMDAELWGRLMDGAADADMLVCLGDLAMKNPHDIYRKLKQAFGDRLLTILGNHDSKGVVPKVWAAAGARASAAFSLPRAFLKETVEKAHGELADLVDWDRLPRAIHFGLSHWPLPPSRMPGAGWINLHGHIHFDPSGPLGVNCCVEATDYRPMTLDRLLTPELMDNLVRRQSGPLPEVDHALVPGDSGWRP